MHIGVHANVKNENRFKRIQYIMYEVRIYIIVEVDLNIKKPT